MAPVTSQIYTQEKFRIISCFIQPNCHISTLLSLGPDQYPGCTMYLSNSHKVEGLPGMGRNFNLQSYQSQKITGKKVLLSKHRAICHTSGLEDISTLTLCHNKPIERSIRSGICGTNKGLCFESCPKGLFSKFKTQMLQLCPGQKTSYSSTSNNHTLRNPPCISTLSQIPDFLAQSMGELKAVSRLLT